MIVKKSAMSYGYKFFDQFLLLGLLLCLFGIFDWVSCNDQGQIGSHVGDILRVN